MNPNVEQALIEDEKVSATYVWNRPITGATCHAVPSVRNIGATANGSP